MGASADDDVGLDPEVWIFDSTGTLIAQNDDSDFFEIGPPDNAGTDPGSDPWADHDSFIGELVLPAGTYYAVVTYYDNDASAESQGGYTTTPLSISGDAVSGVTPDATFDNDATCSDPGDPEEQCTGGYQLLIRDQFLFVPPPIPAVGGFGLLLMAFALGLVAVWTLPLILSRR
ncbi:MAG TPA: DVUA0089 family protein [Thermoanaerobaculia bacterium]|nr:DVUA0089 family protein [Thermoanaerobaculia bacterium]